MFSQGATERSCPNDELLEDSSPIESNYFFKVNFVKLFSQGDTDSFCPTGWTWHKSNCYKYQEDKLTWDQAESGCQKFGGHLVSIHTLKEYFFVNSISKEFQYWMGGSDSQKEGDWVWSDGSPWVFSSWGPSEPNNGQVGDEHCLGLLRGWNDYSCDTKFPSICKKKFCPKGYPMNSF